MNFQKRLDFIAETKKKVFEVPGVAAQKLQAAKKKTAAERMTALFDSGTFVETGAFIKKRSTEVDTGNAYEGVVTGYGAVNGKLVYAYTQDFSRYSGALSEAGVKKILAVYSMAEKNGAPIVSVFDSAGVIITEGIDALSGYGAIINKASILSGVVPQYSVICGVCAGGAAVIASVSDFIFMERSNGRIFINSPFVVKNSTDDKVDEGVGSAESAATTGQCAKIFDGEDMCFSELRDLIDYMPSNNLDESVYTNADDDADRLNEMLSDFVLTENYDMKRVITEIADNNKFFELYEDYCSNIICGFASISNITVGIVASQPMNDGGIICPGVCDKAARFIYVCDSFNIPLLTLVDTAGMMILDKAENSQFALSSAKLAAAYSLASVPKITINIGKAYGTAYMIMGSKGLGVDIAMAYPTAQISILAPETAVEIIYGDKIMASQDPVEERANLVDEWEVKTASPVEASSSGQIDNIIAPRQTRQLIASGLFMLQSKREIRPNKKHNKFPL